MTQRTTRDDRHARPVTLLQIAVAAVVALSSAPSASSQGIAPPPFFAGERLTYGVRVGKFGNIGHGTMWVEGPVQVRGVDAYVLHFVVKARVGLWKTTDRTESWLDTRRMAALRFHKEERRPFSSDDESVELYPEQKRWEGTSGSVGDMLTDAPLDELSFIYFVRTLTLVPDSVQEFNRHFEAGRNPVQVRVVGHEILRTAAGEFPTIIVEMRVRDSRHYDREGVIRLNLTDDEFRIPVRITSAMPLVGNAVLTLEAVARPGERVAAATPF